jgi:hypothetical protein
MHRIREQVVLVTTGKSSSPGYDRKIEGLPGICMTRYVTPRLSDLLETPATKSWRDEDDDTRYGEDG